MAKRTVKQARLDFMDDLKRLRKIHESMVEMLPKLMDNPRLPKALKAASRREVEMNEALLDSLERMFSDD